MPVEKTKIKRIVRALRREYRIPYRPLASKCSNPINELVLTILSQNTNDRNSGMAFANLKKRFKTWDELMAAPTASVEKAVYPSGFFHLKARRIRRALAEIRRREGKLSLSRVARMPLGEAKAYLTSLHGVGPKTAAIILMFCFDKPSLPVDTHVFRVSRRLGLVPEKSNPEKAQEILEGKLDRSELQPFHLAIITHGRKICTARSPKCAKCILRRVCPSAKKFISLGNQKTK